MRILIDALEALGVDRARAANDAVDLVALRQKVAGLETGLAMMESRLKAPPTF